MSNFIRAHFIGDTLRIDEIKTSLGELKKFAIKDDPNELVVIMSNIEGRSVGIMNKGYAVRVVGEDVYFFLGYVDLNRGLNNLGNMMSINS